MIINVTEVMCAFSVALDAVEGEILGATTYHAQRIAYLSALMGKELGLSDLECERLAIAALLHDNALTEYIQEELSKGISKDDIHIENNLGKHCGAGEKNVTVLPFFQHIEGAILYHHERCDGSGPFGLKPEDTPLFARIIHIADRADVIMDFSDVTKEKYDDMCARIRSNIGTIYDEGIADLFLQAATFDQLKKISGERIREELYHLLPTIERDYTGQELIEFANFFAKIVDYKSPFTTRHSRGIAEKAKQMGEYYGWDEDTCDKLYFAGAMHDIGKLMVSNEILEKPGKLTPDEYKHIQNHAIGSYVVLSSIRGFEEITRWAALHHEKLEGSGYPFGYTADQLGEKERLMAVLDIYQALVESRPYKDGMPHEKAMSILREMVDNGALDGKITDDVDKRFAP